MILGGVNMYSIREDLDQVFVERVNKIITDKNIAPSNKNSELYLTGFRDAMCFKDMIRSFDIEIIGLSDFNLNLKERINEVLQDEGIHEDDIYYEIYRKGMEDGLTQK